MVVPVRVYGNDKSSFIDRLPIVYWIMVQKSRFVTNLSFTCCKYMVNTTTMTISGVNGMQAYHGYFVVLTVRGAHETNTIFCLECFRD